MNETQPLLVVKFIVHYTRAVFTLLYNDNILTSNVVYSPSVVTQHSTVTVLLVFYLKHVSGPTTDDNNNNSNNNNNNA